MLLYILSCAFHSALEKEGCWFLSSEEPPTGLQIFDIYSSSAALDTILFSTLPSPTLIALLYNYKETQVSFESSFGYFHIPAIPFYIKCWLEIFLWSYKQKGWGWKSDGEMSSQFQNKICCRLYWFPSAISGSNISTNSLCYCSPLNMTFKSIVLQKCDVHSHWQSSHASRTFYHM